MRHAIVVYLPWVLSAITTYSSFLAGDKKLSAWTLALFNQVLWSIWVVTSETWGLLPLNITLWIIYTRNYRKWKKDEEKANAIISDLGYDRRTETTRRS